MKVPLITRQYGFNYSTDFIYEQVVNELINLEKSLVFGRSISGHFSQGHVDTTAKIKKIDFILLKSHFFV